MTKEKIVEYVYGALPYSGQICDVDLYPKGHLVSDGILFTWRGNRFYVDSSLNVNEIEGNLIRGSNIAITIEELLKIYMDRGRKPLLL